MFSTQLKEGALCRRLRLRLAKMCLWLQLGTSQDVPSSISRNEAVGFCATAASARLYSRTPLVVAHAWGKHTVASVRARSADAVIVVILNDAP